MTKPRRKSASRTSALSRAKAKDVANSARRGSPPMLVQRFVLEWLISVGVPRGALTEKAVEQALLSLRGTLAAPPGLKLSAEHETVAKFVMLGPAESVAHAGVKPPPTNPKPPPVPREATSQGASKIEEH